MRYLVNGSNSTYDATNKRFYFNLDRRFPNPTKCRVSRANFVASTASSYPNVVYLRSSAMDDLVKTKHTVELTDANHENPSNVLVVLEETHNVARYRQDGAITFALHGHMPTTRFDFYFTDNGTTLDGVYTPTEVDGVTDVMMEAHVTADDIVVWIDLSVAGNVLNNDDDPAAIDDSVSKIISRAPGGALQMSPNGLDKVAIKALGEGRGVTRQGVASWSAIAGSIALTPDLDAGSHFFLFRSPADAAQLDVLWQSGSLHAFVWSDTIQFKDEAGGYVDTGLVVLDSTDYLLEFRYSEGQATGQTQVLLTKMSDLSVQVAIDQGPLQDPAGTNRSFSTAQAHMNSIMGDYVHCTAAAQDDVKNYLRQRYKGEPTIPVVDPDGKDASFFLQLDIDSK